LPPTTQHNNNNTNTELLNPNTPRDHTMAQNAFLQPDLNAVADSFVTVAEHVRRLDNLPQFNDGGRILAAVEGLGQRMDGLGQRMDNMERNLITRIDTVERNLNARMDGLRTSMTAEYVCYQLCILLLLTHAR
jgi:hypothetical protein